MTHSELNHIGEKWLLKHGCGFAFRELVAYTTYGEIPDVIGWKNGQSILIESKATRADFLKDKKKLFRQHPEYGLGNFRFYLCPKGIITKEDLPDKWGLIVVNEDGKARKVVGGKGNIIRCWKDFKFTKYDAEGEKALMISALRRMHLQGVLDLIYAYRKENK